MGAARCIFLLALALGAALPAAAQATLPPDLVTPPAAGAGELPAWFKYLHFLAGLSVGLSASELVSDSSSPWLRPLVAVGAAAVAGVGKEVLDSTGFGDPRFSDIVVTSIGGLTAAGIAWYAQSIYPATGTGRVNGDAYLISTAVVLALPVIVGAIREIQAYIDRSRAAVASP